MQTTTLAVAVTLPGSPEEVFRTLTDGALHSEATGARSLIEPTQGGRFSYFDGAVTGAFEEISENTRLVQRLRAADWPEDHHAVVRQELSRPGEGSGCRVVVLEEGIPADRLDAVLEGWQAYWVAIASWLRRRRLEIVSRFIDDYKNRQNPDAVDEFVTDDVVFHGPIPGLPPGREGLRKNGQMMCGAFPDVHAERKFFVTEGDIVVERAAVRATHNGELMGIPPSGTAVTWTELHAYRVVGDRIVEIWSEADLAGVMRQIGADADAQAEANK